MADGNWFAGCGWVEQPYLGEKQSNVTQNVTQKLTDRQKEILHLITTDNTISANKMATIHGITIRSIRRDIDALRQYYNIQWVGPSKGGHWEVLTRSHLS